MYPREAEEEEKEKLEKFIEDIFPILKNNDPAVVANGLLHLLCNILANNDEMETLIQKCVYMLRTMPKVMRKEIERDLYKS